MLRAVRDLIDDRAVQRVVVVARLLLRYRWNTIVATGSSWLVWLAVAFGLWAISLR